MNICDTCPLEPHCPGFFCINKRIASGELVFPAQIKLAAPTKTAADVSLYNEHKTLDWADRPHTFNKECSMFLGIEVAETVLGKVFKNVVRTPPNHIGFDFWCNNGFKIDVKSSCEVANNKQPKWQFVIRKNTIADYFLCIAFDNRESLTPLHLWLIPGGKVNNLSGFSIFESTLYKWQMYELTLDKTVACCDAMKS